MNVFFIDQDQMTQTNLTLNVTPLNNTLTNSKFTKSTVKLEDYIIYIIYVKFYKNLNSFYMLLKFVKINGI
jgi:hypothetical protein